MHPFLIPFSTLVGNLVLKTVYCKPKFKAQSEDNTEGSECTVFKSSFGRILFSLYKPQKAKLGKISNVGHLRR